MNQLCEAIHNKHSFLNSYFYCKIFSNTSVLTAVIVHQISETFSFYWTETLCLATTFHSLLTPNNNSSYPTLCFHMLSILLLWMWGLAQLAFLHLAHSFNVFHQHPWWHQKVSSYLQVKYYLLVYMHSIFFFYPFTDRYLGYVSPLANNDAMNITV